MIGQTISHYKILEKIGVGGMGEVYLAEDMTLERRVAIKFLSSDKSADPDSRRRFIHEARAQAIVAHYNVATFHEVGEERDKVFIVMEYIEGQRLSELAKKEKLSLPEILNLAIQVGEGLQAAHEKRVIHRDINPTNILVSSKRVAKITDFGLAKWTEASTITRTGLQLGTDHYMSPEQVDGRKTDHRTDIFSFGVVLYELICTRRPFEGDNREALFYEILYIVPQPLARFCRDVPEDLERIIFKCLVKKPEERYQSVADLVADLRVLKRFIETPGFAQIKQAIPQKKMIAVLPFENLGPPEQEYFADGVTEEIMVRLAKIGNLGIIARTSIIQYKKTKKTIRQIGAELGVDYILEGAIRWQPAMDGPSRVRVTSQLVKVSDASHLWAEIFDRELSQIFAIQGEIAHQIALSLEAKLSPCQESRLKEVPTENLAAYDYYLKGREYFCRYRKRDNENAIALFKKALELDANYALGYAGLGDAYSQRVSSFGFSLDWADAAIEASQKAISIDPNLAEGYSALGRAYFQKGWLRKALEVHHKAVELNPNYSPSVGSIGWINLYMGEFEEALRWMKKTVALNPTNPFCYNGVGAIYLDLGDDAKAKEWFNRALELQPDSTYAHACLSYMYLAQRKYQEALERGQKILYIHPDDLVCLYAVGYVELFQGNYAEAEKYWQKAINLSSIEAGVRLGMRHITVALAYIFWKTGKEDDAKKMFDQSLNLAKRELGQGSERDSVLFDLATINAILNNTAEAFQWLQKAVDAGWRDYRWALIDPRLENLHNDERFKKMMAEVKTKVDEMRRRVEEEEARTRN